MSETWQVFRLAELDSISFECPNCKTVVTFSGHGQIVTQAERNCPGCNKEIPGAGEILGLYWRFYQQGKDKVTLRAKA
ncbi:MAG TPA: hypothetical protein VKX49_12560 [Bryobacteraceae bacterium]|nr:hypothetical protein [Bryobacteraceae bacterium]